MTKDGLITPAELVAHGTVSTKEMQRLLRHLRSIAKTLARDFPDTSFVMDEDNILRVEANAEDAGEIDFILQEALGAYTSFSVTARP